MIQCLMQLPTVENAITRHYYGASNVPFTMMGPKAGKLDGMSVIHADTLDSGKPGDALLVLKDLHK